MTRVMISLDMGGTMRLTIWSRVTFEKDLPLGHAQHQSALLPAPRRHPPGCRPGRSRKIEGVVDDEGHAYRRHPSHLAPGPGAAILQYQTGHIKQGDDLQDQGVPRTIQTSRRVTRLMGRKEMRPGPPGSCPWRSRTHRVGRDRGVQRFMEPKAMTSPQRERPDQGHEKQPRVTRNPWFKAISTVWVTGD